MPEFKMFARATCTSLVGIEAVRVEVEAQVFRELERFSIVGLPDSVLRESKERVRCAIENSGFRFPNKGVVVNLAPASLPKMGSGFDLAIALSILAADGQVEREALGKKLIVGELALDGRVKGVAGVLASAAFARGRYALVIPAENASQAALLDDLEAYPVQSLGQTVAFLNAKTPLSRLRRSGAERMVEAPELTFQDVRGQQAAKRALEIVAAGSHNLLMVGPPGAGKSMLASRLPAILPPLSEEEAIELTKIHSLDSTAGARSGLLARRPFRAPHHSSSASAIIGGGPRLQPGEITLAHRGVLFLDEFSEFRRDALEALRQPLEGGTVLVSRAAMRVQYPAEFVLLAAMNPCPCGKRGSSDCACSPTLVRRYFAKISGPILDRIDLQLWVGPVSAPELRAESVEDPTPAMRARVLAARVRQLTRACKANSRLAPREIQRDCTLDAEATALLEKAVVRLHLSARGYSRMLKVSRTIADLEGSEHIQLAHVAEALSYRLPDEI